MRTTSRNTRRRFVLEQLEDRRLLAFGGTSLFCVSHLVSHDGGQTGEVTQSCAAVVYSPSDGGYLLIRLKGIKPEGEAPAQPGPQIDPALAAAAFAAFEQDGDTSMDFLEPPELPMPVAEANPMLPVPDPVPNQMPRAPFLDFGPRWSRPEIPGDQPFEGEPKDELLPEEPKAQEGEPDLDAKPEEAEPRAEKSKEKPESRVPEIPPKAESGDTAPEANEAPQSKAPAPEGSMEETESEDSSANDETPEAVPVPPCHEQPRRCLPVLPPCGARQNLSTQELVFAGLALGGFLRISTADDRKQAA